MGRDFFFSGRRRHTRWPRDWSSDVCSSDLRADDQQQGDQGDDPRPQGDGPLGTQGGQRQRSGTFGGAQHVRSEERRVGKERRSRWSTYREKRNDEGGDAWNGAVSEEGGG